MAHIVLNSKFKPYSFQERIAPYQQYIEDFKAQENALQDLSTKAATIKNLLGDSSQAAMQYQAYEDELIKQADLLAKEGLNPVNRQGLLNMKKRYNSDITPIQTAIELNRGLSKQKQEALLKDNSLISTEVPTIDDLLKNPNATYNAISGNQLTEKASAISSTLSKIIKDSPQVGKFLDGALLYSQQYGYSPNDVINTILQNDKAPKELKEIVNSLKQEVGYDNWDKASKQRIDSYINSGIYNAIGQSKEDIITDRGYISPAEERRLQIEEERWQLQKDALEEEKNNPYRNIDILKNSDGTALGILPHGKKIFRDAKGNWSDLSSSSSSLVTDSGKKLDASDYDSFEPIIIDKSNWNDSSLDYVGEDTSDDFFNFFDSYTETRNKWGEGREVDYSKLEQVDYTSIPSEFINKLKDKMGKIGHDGYNFYKVKGEKGQYIAYPKIKDSVQEYLKTINKTPNSITPIVDSGDNEGL